MLETNKRIIILCVVVGVFALLIGFVGGNYWGYEKKVNADTIASLFGTEEYEIPAVDFTIMLDAWKVIDEKYVFSDSPSDEDRLWGIVSGLIDSIGDPYSSFMPPNEAETMAQDLDGEFGGVGIEIGMRQGILTVISPLKGTPGYDAGILPGDKIMKVDGESILSNTIDESITLIRGDIGTDVILTIYREGDENEEGETFDVTITRANIEIPTIDTETRDGVFIIKLYNFSGKSNQMFEKALREFKQTGNDKLIIDLRGNPGGYLTAAIDIASMFVPKDKTVVIEDKGEGREPSIHKSKGYQILTKQPDIVVLINEGSASASEIVAAALQEHKLATLVGEKTFGKGSVQELVPLTSDTFIKITVAKWLTPNGISLSDDSITPDIEVELTKGNRDDNIDSQLEKALEILNTDYGSNTPG